MDISIIDRKTLTEDFFNLFRNGVALVDGEVRVHFNHNIKVDITTIGTSALLFNFGNFRNIQNGFFIGLKISLIKAI